MTVDDWVSIVVYVEVLSMMLRVLWIKFRG